MPLSRLTVRSVTARPPQDRRPPVDGLLVGQRAVHDRLDRFGGDVQPLERRHNCVADTALDPDLVVGCSHVSPLPAEFISPLDLVAIGLVGAEEAAALASAEGDTI